MKIISNLLCFLTIIALVKIFESVPSCLSKFARPPLPVLPIPTASQLEWQQREIIMFLHFGMNTFTGSERGRGTEDPNGFNPTGLDAGQWVKTAADAGISLVILTAKHYEGFCLWRSSYTNHSVVSSPWKNGQGDVVGDLTAAARAHGGVDVGLYVSPLDQHEPSYGIEYEYNEFYLAQLHELLNNYGSIKEIWFDDAKPWNGPTTTYYYEQWFRTVKQLQKSINIFSDAGPDVRWVGNEDGFAGETSWSTINRTLITIGSTDIVGYLNTGDPLGPDWVPPECDVSIRSRWFWHPEDHPKELSRLLEIYYGSVGRNCVLLLNVPPNSTGLISDVDVQRLSEFNGAIRSIFSANSAQGSSVVASSQRGGQDSRYGPENVLDDDDLWTYWAPEAAAGTPHWIQLATGMNREGLRFNVVRIQEPIGLGQRISRYEVYADQKLIVGGTTVGYKRLHRLPEVVEADVVVLRIYESRDLPLVSSFGLHFDPFPLPNVTSIDPLNVNIPV